MFFRCNLRHDFSPTIPDGCNSCCKQSSSTILRRGLLLITCLVKHTKKNCAEQFNFKLIMFYKDLFKRVVMNINPIPYKALPIIWVTAPNMVIHATLATLARGLNLSKLFSWSPTGSPGLATSAASF